MQGIFYQCYNLKYLDLSSFDTSAVTNMPVMFKGCNSLVYIKLNSFTIKEGNDFAGAFEDLSPNLKICIDDINTKGRLNQSVNATFDCSDKCFDTNIKIE